MTDFIAIEWFDLVEEEEASMLTQIQAVTANDSISFIRRVSHSVFYSLSVSQTVRQPVSEPFS